VSGILPELILEYSSTSFTYISNAPVDRILAFNYPPINHTAIPQVHLFCLILSYIAGTGIPNVANKVSPIIINIRKPN
jgi:hypothetical protein